MRSAPARRRCTGATDPMQTPAASTPPDPPVRAPGVTFPGERTRGPARERAAPGRRITRKRLAIAAVVLVGLSYATLIQSFSWNQTSHYDLLRALNNGRTPIRAYQDNTGA